jgi:hypothetical protein
MMNVILALKYFRHIGFLGHCIFQNILGFYLTLGYSPFHVLSKSRATDLLEVKVKKECNEKAFITNKLIIYALNDIDSRASYSSVKEGSEVLEKFLSLGIKDIMEFWDDISPSLKLKIVERYREDIKKIFNKAIEE